MTLTTTSTIYTTTGNDLVMTRNFKAPPELVFKAFTDSKELAKWWGPADFTNPICESDPHPGGKRKIVMQAPDGSQYPMTGSYREVIDNTRLVIFDSVAEHNPEWHAMVNKNRPNAKGDLPDMEWTVTFEDQGSETKVTIRYHFEEAEDRDALIKLGMTEGWWQSLDKLEKLLKSSS